MPFYKHVNPGDTVTHCAGRENAISQALGQLHAISAPRTARPAGVARQPVAEYNGYFKIIDASTYNEDGTLAEAKIKIIDGATYDDETGTSGTSRCKVNNAYFDVPQAELAVTAQALNSGYAVFLHYNKNSSTAEETITLEFDETITEDSYNCYYQVGRVLSDNNENAGFSIQQDHVVGVPQMFLFGTCNQDSFVE